MGAKRIPIAAPSPKEGMTPHRKRVIKNKVAIQIPSDSQEIAEPIPSGINTWYAKKTPKLEITPTTAAVIAVSGAVKRRLL